MLLGVVTGSTETSTQVSRIEEDVKPEGKRIIETTMITYGRAVSLSPLREGLTSV